MTGDALILAALKAAIAAGGSQSRRSCRTCLPLASAIWAEMAGVLRVLNVKHNVCAFDAVAIGQTFDEIPMRQLSSGSQVRRNWMMPM